MKKIIEQTSSAASGSFETPMGSGMVRRNFHPFYDIDSEEVQGKRKKKQLNKKKKPMKKITVSEIENIILKTLIQEEVYSEKPIEPKGREISSKNAKSQIASKTAKKVSDITAKSGKESKSDVSVRNKKVSSSLKNNLKGAEVKDVNKFKKVDDDYETEAYQNGMEDIAYERISDEQKKKNMKNIVSPELRKNPNAETSEKMAKKMISQAKKRKISRDASPFSKIAASGTDIEFLPDSKKQPLPNPRKKLAFENVNTMKRLTFKSHFRDDKDMLRKIPSNYKQNDLVFEMYDGDSNYKVRWEGTETYGTGIILEHKSASLEAKNLKMFESLNKFDRLDFQSERNVQSSTLNENQMFKQMLNQSRRLMNEEPDPETMPDASTQADKLILNYDKEVGIGTVKSSSENAGIDTGIKNNIPDYGFAINGVAKDTIVVPAPTDEDLLGYNQILRGEAPATISDNEVKVNFGLQFNAANGKASDKMGSYFPLGKEGETPAAPTFNTGQGPLAFGAGIGRLATPENSSDGILSAVDKIYNPKEGGKPLHFPAPDIAYAKDAAQVEEYNKTLDAFMDKYHKKLGIKVDWIPSKPNSFVDGKYYIEGEKPKSSAETGSQAKINTTNDRAFDYKLENGKYFFKGKGAYASKYPNWVEATGKGLEGIKANVKF